MVMKVAPLHRAISNICPKGGMYKRILLSPQGMVLNHKCAKHLSTEKAILLICGRYEGVDERVREHLVDEEISIGDYVLTGGEIPAMVLLEVIIRFIPDVLGSQDSLTEESFSRNYLEYPQYTRPAEYQGWRVPDILLSGHHLNIKQWRSRQSLFRTAKYRPDLIEWTSLSSEDREWLVRNGIQIPDTPSKNNLGGAGD